MPEYGISGQAKGKMLLTVTFGMVLWVISAFVYSGWIGHSPFVVNLVNMILLLLAYFGLWIAVAVMAWIRKPWSNLVGLGFFGSACWVTGIIMALVFQYVQADTGLSVEVLTELFVTAMVIGSVSVIGALYIGYLIGPKMGQDKIQRFLWALFISGILLVILEPILYLIFAWSDLWLYAINGIVILWAVCGVIVDGMLMADKEMEDQWLMMAVNIFLSLILIILRIFEVLARLKK